MILIKKVSMMTFDFAELISELPDAWTCWSEEKQESGKWGGEAAACCHPGERWWEWTPGVIVSSAGGRACLVSIWRYRLEKAFFLKILVCNYVVFTVFQTAYSSFFTAVKEDILFSKKMQSKELRKMRNYIFSFNFSLYSSVFLNPDIL